MPGTHRLPEGRRHPKSDEHCAVEEEEEEDEEEMEEEEVAALLVEDELLFDDAEELCLELEALLDAACDELCELVEEL
jgi:hypothetical protein